MSQETTTVPSLTHHSAFMDAPAGPRSHDVACEAVEAFTRLVARAEAAATERDGSLPDTMAAEIESRSNAVIRLFQAYAGDQSSLGAEEREAFAARLRDVMVPWLDRSHLGRRILTKPRGYAGDYLTIAMMYDDIAAGDDSIGTVLDRVLRSQPACRAVVHRRSILAEEIARTRSECSYGEARVMSLACGPAAELFDIFSTLEDHESVQATCVDIDREALDQVTTRALEHGVHDRIQLHEENLFHLATGRRAIEVPEQDLVYSIGLIDYFADRLVVRLLDYVHGLLRSGGRAIFGNFHASNPSKALMDHVLDWKLIHRTEQDMNRLFRESKFGRGCSRIRFDATGVNMFAECVKS